MCEYVVKVVGSMTVDEISLILFPGLIYQYGKRDVFKLWVNIAGLAVIRAATNESQKTRNKCETRNKTVFHTRLRHPETINSVPLNSVLRIKQTDV